MTEQSKIPVIDASRRIGYFYLSESEEKLLEKLREISFGRVIIFIENKIPVRIEEIRESIKL